MRNVVIENCGGGIKATGGAKIYGEDVRIENCGPHPVETDGRAHIRLKKSVVRKGAPTIA